jgi:hypothetical protein
MAMIIQMASLGFAYQGTWNCLLNSQTFLASRNIAQQSRLVFAGPNG